MKQYSQILQNIHIQAIQNEKNLMIQSYNIITQTQIQNKEHNILSETMSDRQQSRWVPKLKWIGTKLTNIWKQSQQNIQKQDPNSSQSQHNNSPTAKNQNKANSIAVEQKQPKQEYNLLDPKTRILLKLRGINNNNPKVNTILQQKIRKANQYFTKKENISEKPCDLLCPICLQLFVKPVTTVCGHSFCIRCLDQTLLFKTDCPSCRNYLRGTKSVLCQSLNAVILRLIEKYPQDEQQFYHQLYKDTIQWLQSRNPDPELIKPGDKLDVKDTEFIWCQAIVRELYYKHGRVSSVLVHYMGWNSVYDEIIDIQSDRLASVGFYTARRELPHYRGYDNGQQQQRMYGYVVNSQVQALNAEMMNLNINNLNMNMQNINNNIMLDPHIDTNVLFALNNNLLGFQFGNNLNQAPNIMNINLYNGNLYNNFYNQYQVERGRLSEFDVIEEREDEEVEAQSDGQLYQYEREGSQNGFDVNQQYRDCSQNQYNLDPQLWQDDPLDNNGEIVDLITGEHHQITWTNNQMILHPINHIQQQQRQQKQNQQQQQGELPISKQARFAQLQHFQQKMQDNIEQSLYYIKKLQQNNNTTSNKFHHCVDQNDCNKKGQKRMNHFSQQYQGFFVPKDQDQDYSDGEDWNKIQCVYKNKFQNLDQQKSLNQMAQFSSCQGGFPKKGQSSSKKQVKHIQSNQVSQKFHNCQLGGYYQLNQQNEQQQSQQYHSTLQKKEESIQNEVQQIYSSRDMQKLQNLEMQVEKFGINLLRLLQQHDLHFRQNQQNPQPVYNSEPCINLLNQNECQKNPEQTPSCSFSPEKVQKDRTHKIKLVDIENRQKQMQIQEDKMQQLKQQQNQIEIEDQNQKKSSVGIYNVQIL